MVVLESFKREAPGESTSRTVLRIYRLKGAVQTWPLAQEKRWWHVNLDVSRSSMYFRFKSGAHGYNTAVKIIWIQRPSSLHIVFGATERPIWSSLYPLETDCTTELLRIRAERQSTTWSASKTPSVNCSA